MSDIRAYWDRGVAAVPMMTGAATLMRGEDILEHAERLGLSLPLTNVLDVGCGTGRVAAFCSGYLGVDIAPSAIGWCQAHGVPATLIEGPADLPQTFHDLDRCADCQRLDFLQQMAQARPTFDWVVCLSVFTHIDRDERCAYLTAFAARAPRLLVDIIPGDGSGGVALWTAQVTEFEADLHASGFDVQGVYERLCPSGPTHRYYLAHRRPERPVAGQA